MSSEWPAQPGVRSPRYVRRTWPPRLSSSSPARCWMRRTGSVSRSGASWRASIARAWVPSGASCTESTNRNAWWSCWTSSIAPPLTAGGRNHPSVAMIWGTHPLQRHGEADVDVERRVAVDRYVPAGGAMPGIATLTGVSSKKRNSRKGKIHRQGVSGNPQRRAQQWRPERRVAQGQSAFGQLPREPQTDPDRAAFRELAYRLAGGAPAAAWWRESHERVLARARALTWPSRLVDLETQACQIVGDEFYDRLQSPETGLHPAQWLRALAEETGAALRAALAQEADDWQKLWALLCGLALTTPTMIDDGPGKTAVS